MAELSKIELRKGEFYDLKDAYARGVLANLKTAMIYKGSLGTEGTASDLPEPDESTIGFTYNVVNDGTYGGQQALTGDIFVCDETPKWIHIVSGGSGSGGAINGIERNGVPIEPINKIVNILVPESTSELVNNGDGLSNFATLADLPTRVGQLQNDNNYQTDVEVSGAINAHDLSAISHLDIRQALSTEATTRASADDNLQEQINAISASSDVVDIVGTYAELLIYDTTKLHNNAVIKVLTDETHNNAISYYRWLIVVGTPNHWDYIGSEGPYYTISAADSKFVPQVRTINGKALSGNITLTSSDVGALPSSTYISNSEVIFKKNGTQFTSFNLNQSGDVTINYDIPTAVSQLSDAGDYALSSAIPSATSDLSNDGSDGVHPFITAEYHDNSKQDVINDLSTIRQNATLATTALQPNDNISDLVNDAGYITDSYHDGTKQDLITLENKLSTDYITGLSSVATSGNYNDLSNKPTIPDELADLSDDTDHRVVTDSQISEWDNKQDKLIAGANISIVESSEGPVISSSGSSGGAIWGQIIGILADQTDLQSALNTKQDTIDSTHKLDVSLVSGLANVATSGSYNDLSNKPSIPTNTSDLTNDSNFVVDANYVHTDNNFTTTLKNKLDGIASGAQVNTLESVKVNGSPLTIIDKAVDISVPTNNNQLTNGAGYQVASDVTSAISTHNSANDAHTDIRTAISTEATNRIAADASLQSQIDAISAASDVVDVVATYAALQAYDTTKLNNNDIIKVLDDEEHDDSVGYYRWKIVAGGTNHWDYIGSEGPYYTVAEADAEFVPQTRTINNIALDSNITLTASDVGALPSNTTIGNAILTIQKNGTDVATFGANATSAVTANITVPTSVSGTVSQPSFTGTQGNISVSGTPSGSVAVAVGSGAANYTPAGTNTGTAVTLNTTTVPNVTDAGSAPSLSYTARTVGSASGWSAGSAASSSYSNGVLTISNGTAPTLTVTDVSCDDITSWNAGSATTLGTAITVATSVKNVTNPTFTGTGVNLTGSFTGSALTATGTFTPEGTVSQPTFSGSIS